MKYSTITFIEKAISIHGDTYNYTKTKYVHSHEKVIIICPIHGEFEQRASKHLEGSGCKKCATTKTHLSKNIYRKGRKLNSTKAFIKEARKIHKNKYDYSKSEYRHSHENITICCLIHGEFNQQASRHLDGNGCIECAYEQKAQDYNMTTEYFITKAQKIHLGKYDYTKTKYINAKTPLIITCKKHGDFKQLPINHYAGSGCPKCGRGNISQMEQDWLDSLNIPNDNKHRQVSLTLDDTVFIVDGYNKETKTIYEFWGDFWHGHPAKYDSNDLNPVLKKTFGQLYEKTEIRRKKILEHGYRLIEIWETDWKLL